MFTIKEKIALVIAGIEIVVIMAGGYAIRKHLADNLGIDVKDLKNVRTKKEYDRLKNREA